MSIRSFEDPAAEEFRSQVRAWILAALPDDWGDSAGLKEEDLLSVRRDWDAKLFRAGYAGLSWPREHGGQGLGLVEEAIFYEEAARAHAPEGLGRVGRHIVGPMLIQFGSDDQKDKYLSRMLSAVDIWCQGYSEPSAGSDLAAMKSVAVRVGDHYEIHGSKVWTSHAHYSDRCILLARSAPDRPKYDGVSIFLVDMHQERIDVRPIQSAAGDHHFNEVVFDGAIVHESDRLGPEHEGWAMVRSSLVHERGVTTALSFYIEMCREVALLATCCGEDEDKALIENLRLKNELVHWHVLRLTEMLSRNEPAGDETSVLKLYWTELWQALTHVGVSVACQLHEEYWWYQFLQSRASTIWGGTSEIQRDMIARRVIFRENRVPMHRMG